jgi:hypothetical protein
MATVARKTMFAPFGQDPSGERSDLRGSAVSFESARAISRELAGGRAPDRSVGMSEELPSPSCDALGATRFAAFPRYRSLAGADVFPRGLPTQGARPVDVVPLEEALSHRWDDDRHVVLYTSDRPFRVNNAALGNVRVEMRLLALDVDNHDEAEDWLDAERPKVSALLAAHPGGFVHTTRRGWRGIFALPAAIPIRSEADKESFALFYARVAAYVFEKFGIVADDALTRWNQPVRLPHVVRDGHPFDAEVIGGDARALGAFELPDVPAVPDLRSLAAVLPRWGGVAKRWQPARQVLRVSRAAFDHVPLPAYADRIAAAERWAREEAPRAVMHHGGRATARSVAATLHVGFALEREDVARILMGSYNRRRCAPPWAEAELEDLRGIAQRAARLPIQAWGFMLTRDRTGIDAARATLAAAAASRSVVALEDVPARLVAAVEEHAAVLLRATYGAGKTHVISQYIASRTTGRVIVVVPRHELARAWVTSLASSGEHDVAYHASVVQRRDEKGRRHCDNKLALKLYRHGGDVARDVCPSCPRAPTCPAYAARPKANARVHVLPREMIAKFEVTAEDLVVFDDAAIDLLAWHRIGVRQLQRLTGADAGLLPRAQSRFLRIFIEGLIAGPRRAEAMVRAALQTAAVNIPAGDALRFVATQLIDGQRTPRVSPSVLAERGGELTDTLRDVERIRQVLRFAAAYVEGGKIRWSEGSRTIHGESAAAKLLRGHGGRLILLDAAANVEELHALRSDLHVERLDVDDAGDASRLLLFAKDTTRTALRDPRRARALLDVWIRAVLAHLTERRVRRPVFVAYKALAPDLRTHPAIVAWCAAVPGREAAVAHYGALRGSNRFRRCDAVVTLCDPWLNGDDVTGRAERLGLDEPSYRVALPTAELGQAHGRSRSVRRRRRLTHVHVGRLVPDGWGAGAVAEPLGGPPERTHGTADRIEFGALIGTLGGNRAASSLLGCSSSAIAGWRGGSRGLPRNVLERTRSLVTNRLNPSASSGEPVAGRGMDAVPWSMGSRGCVHGLTGEAFRVCAGEGCHSNPAEAAVGVAETRLAREAALHSERTDQSRLDRGHACARAECVAQRSEVRINVTTSRRLRCLASSSECIVPGFDEERSHGSGPRSGQRPEGPSDSESSLGRSRLREANHQDLNASFAARALAMIEQLSPSLPCDPLARDHPPRSSQLDPEELALLLEAQFSAQRRRKLRA